MQKVKHVPKSFAEQGVLLIWGWKQSIAKEDLCQDDKNQWVSHCINNHITLVRTQVSLHEHQIQQKKNKKKKKKTP